MRQFQASIHQEGPWFVAQCLEIDIASQGHNPTEALANLREAIELFFECASEQEIKERVHQVEIAGLEAAVG